MWQKATIVASIDAENEHLVGRQLWVKVGKPIVPASGATVLGGDGQRYALTKPYYVTNLRCPSIARICTLAECVELISEFAETVEMQDL